MLTSEIGEEFDLRINLIKKILLREGLFKCAETLDDFRLELAAEIVRSKREHFVTAEK